MVFQVIKQKNLKKINNRYVNLNKIKQVLHINILNVFI